MKLRTTLMLGALALGGGALLVWEQPVQEHYRQPVLPTPVADQTALNQPAPSVSESHNPADPGPADCTIITHYLPNDDGTVTEVYSCEKNFYQAEHPYHGYSDEALVSLAYSEAKAAEILSWRWRKKDEETAMSLAIRASALSGGDALPLLMYSQAYPHPSAIDDVPVLRTYRVKYVLSAVAMMLGDDTLAMPVWEARLRSYSEDPETELAILDERARQIVDEMRRIQLDVLGETTIGG